jgi:hypothetical protein
MARDYKLKPTVNGSAVMVQSDATAKGDIFVATGNAAVSRLAVGTKQGQAALVDSNAASGLRYNDIDDSRLYNELLGWSLDPATASAGQILTAATLYLVRIPLIAQISVTNVLAALTVVGATMTNAFGALYKSDGTLIGQSANQSSAGSNWSSGVTLKTIPLTGGPFTVTPLAVNDFVWGALYVGTATTAPTFARGAIAALAAGLNAGVTASRARFAQQAVANTATLPNITPSSNTTNALPFFMALS